MQKPIQIVYSWIGPKGPIVNTELPNILCFSAVAHGAQSTSHNFWTDDIWWRVFLPHSDYVLASPMALNDSDKFIYPFTLGWRIPFNLLFFPKNGILEFSHTPHHVIHQVRTNGGYFLLDMSAEAFVTDGHLNLIHSYFSFYNHIPMGKIIYLTGCMNVDKVYADYCTRKGIPEGERDRMKMISFPVSQNSLAQNLKSAVPPTYDSSFVPQKRFLSWNRRFRKHRSTLALAFEKYGMIDNSYYSMDSVDPENASYSFRNSVNMYSDPEIGITPDLVDRFVAKLPLVIDGETDINQMCQDFDGRARSFYTNSLVSVVTETNFDTTELTLTEKSWKPAKEKHPFIIVGVPGALKAMREIGLKTFSDFWPEDYDEIEDHAARMARIVDICKMINSWSDEHVLEFKRNVQPIVEHNYNAVQINTAYVVADKLSEYIRRTNP
jgi:hypothetical protein